MEQYGYRQDEIFEALNYYVGYLIKLGSNEMPRPFRIRKGVVKAYLRLVTEPAYLDNMAMLTPVDEVVRNQMVQTDSFAPSDFLNRVYTTLGFLWQIHLDEK